ncbi:class I tRNA ligase family protein [Mesomycoplasma hyorhinis]|uniref:class I tRNA ligase family protein n=1 Tax=Mesomycoplasma hyorhinis TaxID=2100 RepID=UPI001C057A4F|nr:class I tRNA ligase family protein [Mesomycoplasma hyorhinis]
MTKKENIYVCGPTVYDYIHIGNLRPILTIDILNRVKKYFKYELFFLHNITNIDDKIIKKAILENKTEAEISEFYYKDYMKKLKLFNIQKPTKIVKVTNELNTIKNYIYLLQKQGFTYQENDDLYFNTSKVKNYGHISGQKINSLVSSSKTQYKSNANDFALWKKTTLGIKYYSLLGLGRPGWHTECSALIFKYFNKQTIDIHSGGIDLIFPHHENENAQHFALTKKNITKKWVHVGQIKINNEKMSKSLNNVFLVDNFVEKYHPDVYRHILLTSSISGPIDLTNELLEANKNKIIQYKKAFFEHLINPRKSLKKVYNPILKLFLQSKFAQANKELNLLLKNKDYANLSFIFNVLGFIFATKKLNKTDFALLEKWKKLKSEKNYQKADKIREKLWNKFIFS